MSTKKILLVEDDLMLLYLLNFRLKKEGYHVVTANNGKDAISKIKSDSPDLVISDIMMPFVSGLELTAFIKNEYQNGAKKRLLNVMNQKYSSTSPE